MATRSKLSERQKLIFLVTLLVTLGIVLAINWASKRVTDVYGPTVLAQASDGRVWLSLNHELHVLDRYGASLNRIPATSIGITPPIAALAPGPDGAMIVGSRETGLLHLIDASGAARATVDPGGGDRRLFGAFHLLPLPGTSDLIVADTSNHRVVRMARDGKVLKSYGSSDGQPGTLNFPNGLALDRDGKVLLVDTNHHDVKAFTQELEPVATSGFTARADRGYVWPALIEIAPDGTRFVSIMADGMERGRVFTFGPDGARLAELELPVRADPSGLLVRADDALVSDQFGLAVHRYALDGRSLGEFGDESLRAAYAEVAQQRSLYRNTIRGGQLFLLFALAGMLWMLRRERRAQERAGAEIAVQAVEYGKPGLFRRFTFSFWAVLRVCFVVLTLYVVANLVLWSVGRPFNTLLVAAAAADLLILVVLPCAVAVWHFDRMLRAGRYGEILDFGAQTLLRRLGEALGAVLQRGETIERLAIATSTLGPAQLLVLTERRLLVLTLRANLRSLGRAQDVVRPAVSRVAVRARDLSFVRRLVGALNTTLLRIEVSGKRHTFPVIDPVAAAELAKALSATAKGAGAGIAHLRDIAIEGASPGRDGYALPLLLSAILPGLGQLRQQRLGSGVIMFLCAASWVLQLMGPVFAIIRKTSEVDPLLFPIAIGGYAFIWGVSLLDTYLAARVEARR